MWCLYTVHLNHSLRCSLVLSFVSSRLLKHKCFIIVFCASVTLCRAVLVLLCADITRELRVFFQEVPDCVRVVMNLVSGRVNMQDGVVKTFNI